MYRGGIGIQASTRKIDVHIVREIYSSAYYKIPIEKIIDLSDDLIGMRRQSIFR